MAKNYSGTCINCGGPLFQRTCYVCLWGGSKKLKPSVDEAKQRLHSLFPASSNGKGTSVLTREQRFDSAGGVHSKSPTEFKLEWRPEFVSDRGNPTRTAIYRAYRVAKPTGLQVQLRLKGGTLS